MLSTFETNSDCISKNFFAKAAEQPNPPQLDIDDVNDQMDVDDEGHTKVPSPIPIWPKPLALQYQNYLKHYTTLTYKDTERMEAGSRLIASMLEFYFPRERFRYWRVDYQSKTLIDSVPVEGTIYWLVVHEEAGYSVYDTTLANESTLEVPPDTKHRTDATVPPEKKQLVLLVAVVTETKFLHLPERSEPSKLKFPSAVSTENGAVMFASTDNIEYRHGNVLILGGTGKPKPLPSLEFYNFDVDRYGTSLIPWFGQLDSAPDSLSTNIFSLATSEAEKVDRMLRGIVSTASGTKALHPTSTELVQIVQAQVAKRENLKPQSQAILNPKITNEYLNTLRVNKSGRLQGEGGRFLTKDKEKEARGVARVKGIRFQPCSYHVKSYRERKQAKLARENRLSMTADMGILDIEKYGGGKDEGYGSA